jgi:hypothetical protein
MGYNFPTYLLNKLRIETCILRSLPKSEVLHEGYCYLTETLRFVHEASRNFKKTAIQKHTFYEKKRKQNAQELLNAMYAFPKFCIQ